jgi:hypothetical protein
LAQKIIDTLNGKPIVDDFPGFAPAPSASADDAVSPTGAPADDSAEYGNHRINISSDKDKTRMLITELRDANIDDTNKEKEEVISMLESTPGMLEFRGDNLVLVHSYYSRASQFLTKDKKICDKSKKVVDFLKKYYSSQKIVSLTDELKTKCSRYMSPTELMSDDIQPEKIVPASVVGVLGGSKSRRRHRRHRKHARKTRHKRAHRSRAARKHKKYSRRR